MSRSSSKTTKPAKKSAKGVGNLSELDSRKLRKATRRLKEEDERTYRRPWSYRSRPKRVPSSASHRSSSEESMEIELPATPYQMGSLGLMGREVMTRRTRRVVVMPAEKKEKKRSVEVDPWSVRLLNDAGILSNFEEVPPNRIALRSRTIRKRRGTKRENVY